MENFKSEKIDKLTKAVIGVMKNVKSMEKNSRVGVGKSAYDGTKDIDVKEVFNHELANAGLMMVPIDVQESTQIDRWEEEDQWSKAVPKAMKTKQSVFTKVNTKYLLSHTSDQWIVIAGYGHGIDPQDKGAGKATTYAMKNALLYAFLTPVGKIDDTDTKHSNDHATPNNNVQKKTPIQKQTVTIDKPDLIKDSKEWESVLVFLNNGKLTKLSQVTKKFVVDGTLQVELEKLIEDTVNNRILEEKVSEEASETPVKKDPVKKDPVKNSARRLPAIPNDLFKATLSKGTKVEILKVLGNYRMSADQREQLTKKAN